MTTVHKGLSINHIRMKNAISLYCLYTQKHPHAAMHTCVSICLFARIRACGFLSISLHVCYQDMCVYAYRKQHGTRQTRHGAPWFGDPIVMPEQ